MIIKVSGTRGYPRVACRVSGIDRVLKVGLGLGSGSENSGRVGSGFRVFDTRIHHYSKLSAYIKDALFTGDTTLVS